MQIPLLQMALLSLGLLTVWLDIRESAWARPLSLLGTAVALGVYYPAKLYAKCLLNVCYIFLNTYGWYQWLYGGVNRTPLKVSKTNPKVLVSLFVLGLAVTVGAGKLLTLYSDAALPYWDSLHMVFCLIAQWMLVRKKMETWLLWIALDLQYTYVCYAKGLYPFIIQRIVYLFLAIQGYRTWRKSFQKQGTIHHTKDN